MSYIWPLLICLIMIIVAVRAVEWWDARDR